MATDPGTGHTPGPYTMNNGAFADKFHAFSDAIIHGVVEGVEPIVDNKQKVFRNDQTFNIVGAALVHLVDVDHPERKPTMNVSTSGDVPDVLHLNFKGVNAREMQGIAHALNNIAGVDPCDGPDAARFQAIRPPNGYSASLAVPRALMDPLLQTINGNLNTMENSDPGLRGLITSTPDGGTQMTAQATKQLLKTYIKTPDF